MQRIHLDLKNDIFYCPATGRLIHGPDWFEPSPATVFMYSNELGELAWAQEEYDRIWERVNPDRDEDEAEDAEDDDEWEDPEARLERFLAALPDPNLLVFALTTHGFACGPIWSTDCVGIDMNLAAIDEEEPEA